MGDTLKKGTRISQSYKFWASVVWCGAPLNFINFRVRALFATKLKKLVCRKMTPVINALSVHRCEVFCCVWGSRDGGTRGAIVRLLFLSGNTQLTCICEDGVVAAVIGEAHPGAQRELVQFGQRLLVLHGALVLDGELLGAALVVRDLCHARTPPQKQCEREESSVKRAQWNRLNRYMGMFAID